MFLRLCWRAPRMVILSIDEGNRARAVGDEVREITLPLDIRPLSFVTPHDGNLLTAESEIVLDGSREVSSGAKREAADPFRRPSTAGDSMTLFWQTPVKST